MFVWQNTNIIDSQLAVNDIPPAPPPPPPHHHPECRLQVDQPPLRNCIIDPLLSSSLSASQFPHGGYCDCQLTL